MGVWTRKWSSLLVGVALTGAVIGGGVGVTPARAGQAANPPVVDPDGVLTADEQAFVREAVQRVRRRSDYFPTVLVLPQRAGGSAQSLVDEHVAIREDEPNLVLVLRPGQQAAVVTAGDVDGLDDVASDAQLAARLGQSEQGLAHAGAAFTASLTEDGVDENGWLPGDITTEMAWSAVILVVVGFFVLRGMRGSGGPVSDDGAMVNDRWQCERCGLWGFEYNRVTRGGGAPPLCDEVHGLPAHDWWLKG